MDVSVDDFLFNQFLWFIIYGIMGSKILFTHVKRYPSPVPSRLSFGDWLPSNFLEEPPMSGNTWRGARLGDHGGSGGSVGGGAGSRSSILTVQAGRAANYVGAHWWNIQDDAFGYNEEPGVDQVAFFFFFFFFR